MGQTLNDTIPYLQSKITNNISLYKDKPLKTLLDKIPYPIKGYSKLGEDTNKSIGDVNLIGIILYLSPKIGEMKLFLNNPRSPNYVYDPKLANYSPKTITVYFKNCNTPFLNPTFKGSLDENNWTDFIQKEFRNPKYIVDRIELSNN